MLEFLKVAAVVVALIALILFCLVATILFGCMFCILIKQLIEKTKDAKEIRRMKLLNEFENARIQAEIDLHRMETQGELYHG